MSFAGVPRRVCRGRPSRPVTADARLLRRFRGPAGNAPSRSPAQRRLHSAQSEKTFGFTSSLRRLHGLGGPPSSSDDDALRDAAEFQHAGAKQPPFGFSSMQQCVCVRIAEGRPKTEVEWAMLRAAALPAPGEGQPDFGFSTLDERGGRFNGASKPKSQLEWAMLRAAALPAPGEGQPPFGFSSLKAPHHTCSAHNRRQMERAAVAAAKLRCSAKLH